MPTKWVIGGLLALNAALGVGLYLRTPEKTAYAQLRGRADLLTIAGNYNSNSVVYMLDAQSGILATVTTDQNNKKVNLLSRINISRDLQSIR